MALLLSAYGRANFRSWTGSHPGSVVAPGVAVVSGPIMAASDGSAETPSPVAPYPWPKLVLIAMAALAFVTATGLGWALGLFDRGLLPLGQAVWHGVVNSVRLRAGRGDGWSGTVTDAPVAALLLDAVLAVAL